MRGRLVVRLKPHLRCQRLWDVQMWARRRRVPLVPSLLWWTILTVFGAQLPVWNRRPDELYLMHDAMGVVINQATQFLGPTIIFQHVTIGERFTGLADDGAPIVGRYVLVGAGAKLLGPITIGDYVIIGANAVVTRDVPDMSIATGNPATYAPLRQEDVLRVFAE